MEKLAGYALEANIGGVSMLRGADGKSAYEIAVQNGYTGTEAEWLASLRGDAFQYSDFTDEQLAALKGVDGTSPTVATSKTGKVTTITVTDKDGEHTATINDGADGKDGADATDEQVQAATDAWLEAHPEATTTVQDGSITESKLAADVAEKLAKSGYVYDEAGRKYTMAVVDGEIVLTLVFEAFPGKEILAEIFAENIVTDEETTNENEKYTLYNSATGETVPCYNVNLDPFINKVVANDAWTEAGKRLLANTTGAYTVIGTTDLTKKQGALIQNCYGTPINNIVYAKNLYGDYGWDTLKSAITNLPYINSAGEYTTFSVAEQTLETRFSQVATQARGWTEPDILAFSFGADGVVTIIYCDQILAAFQAPEDWKAWAFAEWARRSKQRLGAVTEMKGFRTDGSGFTSLLFLNDAVTLEDIGDYYAYLTENLQPESILAPDGLYLQPGDTVALYAKVEPDGAADAMRTAVADESVATYADGKITGQEIGETALTLKAGDIRAEVPIHVGQQTGVTVTSERTIAEIAIANPVSELQVGDEWALYAIAKDADAVPYDVADDNIVTMSSSAPDVVAVEFGVLRARAAGAATITVADHTGTVTTTMDVTVVAADDLTVPERDVYHVDDRTHNIYNDGTHPQETTVGLQAALDYAAEQNYRKIVFNQGTYLCNADYGVLTIPSGMIVDFNGAEIHLEYGSQAAAGYTFITIDGGVKTVLRNLTVYAENAVQTGGSKSDVTLRIKGDSSRVRVENCAFLDSPGFNVSCHYTRTAVVGFKFSNVEAGGINDDGTPDTEAVSGRFRAKDYIDISGIGETFGLGNMQGYQGYLYMRARLYDIYFYDSDKNLISSIKDCVQYQQYDKPDGAAYCKIVFYQADAPTSGDPDYASIAHIYTATQPRFCTFKDCRFERAVMTGLSPQGCIALTLDGCIFADNGSADPYAHIDWEDGRQHMQGHIVRDCSFAQSASKWHCNVEAPGGGRNIVMHGCTVQGGSVSVGSESQNWRMYHNDFRETTVSLASKGDMVFAGNIVKAAPTTEAPVGGTIHLLDNTITG